MEYNNTHKITKKLVTFAPELNEVVLNSCCRQFQANFYKSCSIFDQT